MGSTTRCHECGRDEDLAVEIRRLLKRAKHNAEKDTRYGRACTSLLPHYEQAASALDAASECWSAYLRSFRPAPVGQDGEGTR